MASPDNERGRPATDRNALESLATAKQLDTAKGTPHLARLSHNGRPGLTLEYARRVGWLDSELVRLLRDPEAGALAVVDGIGPRAARALAAELLRLCQEVRR